MSVQRSCLTLQEQQYADSFRFDRDGRRFIQGRFWVKSILATYLDRDVKDVHFKYNAYGKPDLKDNFSSLSFNVSHSQELIVLAVGQRFNIGVDIEVMKEEDIKPLLTPELFTPRELCYLNALETQDQRHAFYHLWVCKEASLKALGIGLSEDLKSVEIDPLGPSTRSVVRDRQRIFPPCYLFNLETILAPDIGVVAISDPLVQITYCNL